MNTILSTVDTGILLTIFGIFMMIVWVGYNANRINYINLEGAARKRAKTWWHMLQFVMLAVPVSLICYGYTENYLKAFFWAIHIGMFIYVPGSILLNKMIGKDWNYLGENWLDKIPYWPYRFIILIISIIFAWNLQMFLK